MSRLPLSLTQGDIDQLLDGLAAMDATSLDPLSKKVRALLDLGMPRARLRRAILLMAQAPGTTGLVEQNHASGAVLLRHYQSYTEATLCARSLVNQARHLIGATHYERRCERIEAAMRKVEERSKCKRTGQTLFLRELSKRGPQRDGFEDEAGHIRQRSIVRAHAGEYAKLPNSRKVAYEAAAAKEDKAKRAQLAGTVEQLQSELELRRFREAEDRRMNGVRSHSGCFRYSSAGLERMCELWNSLVKERCSLNRLKARKLQAPACTPAEHQRLFLEVEKTFDFGDLACPWWCKPVCNFREHFQGRVDVRRPRRRPGAHRLLVRLRQAQPPLGGLPRGPAVQGRGGLRSVWGGGGLTICSASSHAVVVRRHAASDGGRGALHRGQRHLRVA